MMLALLVYNAHVTFHGTHFVLKIICMQRIVFFLLVLAKHMRVSSLDTMNELMCWIMSCSATISLLSPKIHVDIPR